MPTTSTAAAENHICPLCGERFANDHRQRGFVRHTHRAPRTLLAGRVSRMNYDERLYFERTARCPFQIGQRDALIASP
jgi:hypothetical protein